MTAYDRLMALYRGLKTAYWLYLFFFFRDRLHLESFAASRMVTKCGIHSSGAVDSTPTRWLAGTVLLQRWPSCLIFGIELPWHIRFALGPLVIVLNATMLVIKWFEDGFPYGLCSLWRFWLDCIRSSDFESLARQTIFYWRMNLIRVSSTKPIE